MVRQVFTYSHSMWHESRQLNGSIIPLERPNHMMMEVWNPLGIVGVITAFNFPCVVLGWNACIALVCGNCIVWKGVALSKETKKEKKSHESRAQRGYGFPILCTLLAH